MDEKTKKAAIDFSDTMLPLLRAQSREPLDELCLIKHLRYAFLKGASHSCYSDEHALFRQHIANVLQKRITDYRTYYDPITVEFIGHQNTMIGEIGKDMGVEVRQI